MKRFANPYKYSILGLLLIFALTISLPFAQSQADYLSVSGPCNLKFPKDHGPHPGYRTEWWYYTGNLKSETGRRYGYQLTFFRSQMSPLGAEKKWPQPSSAWRTQQVYLGHAALTDIAAKKHLQAEIAARQALGMAGAFLEAGSTTVFVKNWFAQIGSNRHFLKMNTDDFSFELNLEPVKPPVLHGMAGYSRKGSTPERASCYYSFTRLKTKGIIFSDGKSESAEGLSWMDHEFSTAALEPGLAGWDWFSIQLSDQTEMMLYLLRQKNGDLSPASSGTFVEASGKTRHLIKDTFNVEILDQWRSPTSKAVYPARWRLRIFPLAIDLTLTPALADQEMRTQESTGITYWEGCVSIKGKKEGKPVEGEGYVELTGYAKSFDAPI